MPAFDPNTGHVNNSTNLLAVPVPVAGDGFVFANRLTPLNPPPAGCAFCVATSTLGRLTVSPDGKRLYAVVRNGSGAGFQAGGALAFNIELPDRAPTVTGWQPNASEFLKLEHSYAAPKGDEPVEVAINRDNHDVYLVHGGARGFVSEPPDISQLDAAVHAVIVEDNSFIEPAGSEELTLAAEYINILNGGQTLVSARGLVSEFDAAAATPLEPLGEFPSSLAFAYRDRHPLVQHGRPAGREARSRAVLSDGELRRP